MAQQIRTTSSSWMRGVATTLNEQGLDAAALFADVGLSIDDLDDCDRRWPTEALSRLWVLAAERSGNPDIGLAKLDAPRPDNYGVAGYAMMSSPTLLAGLTRLIRYMCLVSDAVTITLEQGIGGRWVRTDVFGGECPIPRQRYDYGVVNLLNLCRWMLDRPLTPLATRFSHAVPLSIACYNRAFQSPLEFDAPFNGFLVSDQDLACKLTTSAPELSAIHDRIADEALERLVKADTAYRARAAIVRLLPDGSPLRSAIAAELGLSDRTFQRRLADEGLSFSDLVDDVRRELAQRHLADFRMTLTDIGYLLGYADQSTFFRASNRWFGESPGEYRSRLMEGVRREVAVARGP
ncbi:MULTISPECIES: AraC family transcriptional regulator [unclassified Bradyrhizobium]|uniref:AraC family transcriptional regulator n=1 Tax=unclassified Bradyrhizobium TaxID=2631580 RepID=UPI002916B91E|nr:MULTISPECIES: AraC family transcriptional regulator [unclassified Bradyrhizobium]